MVAVAWCRILAGAATPLFLYLASRFLCLYTHLSETILNFTSKVKRCNHEKIESTFRSVFFLLLLFSTAALPARVVSRTLQVDQLCPKNSSNYVDPGKNCSYSVFFPAFHLRRKFSS